MSNIDKFVNEGFVDELMKSGVWDIARVNRGSREEEQTLTENTATEAEEEEVTAASLAEDLLNNLSDEVILEFVNLLHKVALNEDEATEETEETEEVVEVDEALFNTIDESFTAIDKEYDLSESSVEDVMEAVIDAIDEDDLENYESEQVMEALMLYLDEKRGACPSDDGGGKGKKAAGAAFGAMKKAILKK